MDSRRPLLLPACLHGRLGHLLRVGEDPWARQRSVSATKTPAGGNRQPGVRTEERFGKTGEQRKLTSKNRVDLVRLRLKGLLPQRPRAGPTFVGGLQLGNLLDGFAHLRAFRGQSLITLPRQPDQLSPVVRLQLGLLGGQPVALCGGLAALHLALADCHSASSSRPRRRAASTVSVAAAARRCLSRPNKDRIQEGLARLLCSRPELRGLHPVGALTRPHWKKLRRIPLASSSSVSLAASRALLALYKPRSLLNAATRWSWSACQRI